MKTCPCGCVRVPRSVLCTYRVADGGDGSGWRGIHLEMRREFVCVSPLCVCVCVLFDVPNGRPLHFAFPDLLPGSQDPFSRAHAYAHTRANTTHAHTQKKQ